MREGIGWMRGMGWVDGYLRWMDGWMDRGALGMGCVVCKVRQ